MVSEFFSRKSTSLKICGVRSYKDAESLIEVGVTALGFNFWPKSKRYLDPQEADWLKQLKGKVVRVGVFVNESEDEIASLVESDLIDLVQLHGNESPSFGQKVSRKGFSIIKAIGVKSEDDFALADEYEAKAILLDAHAPEVFGGTGARFDWSLALRFQERFPHLPLILAGGIRPENAAEATKLVRPAALDVASGAEISPGVKDLEKVKQLLSAIEQSA